MDTKNVGALWKRVSSKTGSEFLSGLVEFDGVKRKILIFPNSQKKTEKSPDYNILDTGEVVAPNVSTEESEHSPSSTAPVTKTNVGF